MIEKAPLDSFIESPIREIDGNFVRILANRIEKEGYNDAKPLSVTEVDGGKLKIFDGHHRYRACQLVNYNDIPYVTFPANIDLIKAALKANHDEETSKPMTFLDYAFLCSRLHKEGKTYDEIGDKLNWSHTKVIYYEQIANLNQSVLSLIKKTLITKYSENVNDDEFDYVTMLVTNVTFWNPSWFRDITPLNAENQLFVVQEIIKLDGKLKGQKLKELCERLKLHEGMISYVEDYLVNEKAKNGLIADIKNGVFDKIEQVHKKVEELNKEAQRQLILGDARIELNKIDDNYIDVVITDPPYGLDYVSNRREIDYEDINIPITNDEKEQALMLLDEMMDILKRKTKPDAFIYVFCTWKTYPDFKDVIGYYFDIKNVLVWDKMNHGSGDLENWADQYELIIFAKKGGKKLRGERPSNILRFGKVQNRQHPVEKPIDLLKFLIEKSASEGDIICDPFMGVGSTIVACEGKYPYIGIEVEEKYFKIAQRRIKDIE